MDNLTQDANPSQESSEGKVVSITEAARINNVTRQAIYVAIKQHKLKALKATTRWMISLNDLEEYRTNRYSRSKSVYEGKLLFDNSEGYFSISQTAKMLGVPAQKIYYATRTGQLKATRKGAAWVMHKDAIESYKKNHILEEKKEEVQVG